MAGKHYTKDPDALLDYSVSWADWLEDDTIEAAQWIVPTGLTLEAQSHTTTVATVWLSGGTLGSNYRVTSRVTTTAGRVDDRSLTIFMAER